MLYRGCDKFCEVNVRSHGAIREGDSNKSWYKINPVSANFGGIPDVFIEELDKKW